MSPDEIARTRMAKTDEAIAREHLEAGGVRIPEGHIAVGHAVSADAGEYADLIWPWAREYGCGCREVLTDDEATVASDECPKHGQEVVCVGRLTSEAEADALRDERDRLLAACEAARGLCVSMWGERSGGRAGAVRDQLTAVIRRVTGAAQRTREAVEAEMNEARARAQREDG